MGYKEFCGGVLWDNQTIWYTDRPDFTQCFQHTILSWLPGIFLILASPFEISGWLNSKCPRIPFTVLNVTKLLVTLSLVGVCIAKIVYIQENDNDDLSFLLPDAATVGEAVMILSYLFSALILVISLRYDDVTILEPRHIFGMILL